MDNNEAVVVQQQATVGDIINAHINGMSGYEIAEKYGLDTEKVKEIIHKADEAGKFVPAGMPMPVDKVNDVPMNESTPVSALNEGENPFPVKKTTDEPK